MANPPTPPTESDIEALLDAAAKLQGIAIRAEWRAPAIQNLKVTAEAAAFVAAFPLDDEAEPAPMFVA